MLNQSKIQNYIVYYQPLESGGYNVVVPAIPEICTFGENLEEAKKNAKEAILCVLESSLKQQQPLPTQSKLKDLIREQISIPLPV